MSEQNLKLQIIKKAWEDSKFKALLLDNPKAAIKEAFGVTIPESIQLVAMEEQKKQFYLVIPASPTNVLDGDVTVNARW